MIRNNEKRKGVWQLARFMSLLLFALFSFLYLYFLQPDFLACVQHKLSNGVTTYSSGVGVVVITFVLVLLAELILYFLSLPMYLVALAYLPSSVVLALITSAHISQNALFAPLSVWLILGAVLLLGVTAISYVHKYNSFFPKKYDWTDVWTNLMILSVLFLFTGGMGNSRPELHDQLKLERLLEEERYDEIAGYSFSQNRILQTSTAIRSFGLAVEGQLGERLFEVPQYYRSAGLLVDDSAFLSRDSLACKFHRVWGARVGPNIKKHPAFFFQLLLEKHERDSVQNPVLADYYLSALLLERNLKRFVEVLPRYYTVNDSLPRYYQEALVLHDVMTQDSLCRNDSLRAAFVRYESLSEEESDEQIRLNLRERQFGKTYWFYYYERRYFNEGMDARNRGQESKKV